MDYNSEDNSILGTYYINCETDKHNLPPAALGEMFLKYIGSSNEIRIMAELLNIEIVAVTKTPYGKRSKYFHKHTSHHMDTLIVASGLNKIENPCQRCTITVINDGRHIKEIPVFLNGECIAYILAGMFYLKNSDNMLPNIPVISIHQLTTMAEEICRLGNQMLEICCRYVKQEAAEITYDGKMLFNYGSFFDYNLISDSFILSKKTAEYFGWDCTKTFRYDDFINSVVESDRQRVAKFMRDNVNIGDDDFIFDTTIISQTNNQPVNIEITGTIIKDDKGFNVRALGSITDISVLKKTQEELREEINSKNRLIRIIGHDLKNPFNGLIGFSEILKTNLETYCYDDAKDIAELIRKCATEGYDLLVNLLDYSTSQSSNLKAEKSEFDLYKTVDSIINLSTAQALKKGITIHSSVPENTILYSDEYKISTVIRNLVSNAIKFCFKSGVVIIETAQTENGWIRISVSDTGEQLTADKMEKINRSKDVESTYGTAHEKGTSIGLKLCHSFLKVLQSRLVAKSDDGITTFYFDVKPD